MDTSLSTAPAKGRRVARGRSGDLLDALLTLRDRDFVSAKHRQAAWRVIDIYVRHVLPEDIDDDARQETLLTIVEAVHLMRATTDASAWSWLRTVCRNHRVEQHRRRRRGALGRASSDDFTSLRSGDSLPRVDVTPAVLRLLADLIAKHIEATVVRASVRERRQLQARATIRRTALEEALPEILVALSLDIPLPLLAKWIERGRVVIIQTIEALRASDPDMADLLEPFAVLARERRSDAGIPRPERRRLRTFS